MWPWSTKAVISSTGIFVVIAKQYIVWVKHIHFYFMPKIIRILRSCSMKIFSTFPIINISKLHFLLVICIAKNFIWTTLKMIFSIFRFFCTLRFQIFKYCPIITNHTSMERWFIQISNGPVWLVLWSRVTYRHEHTPVLRSFFLIHLNLQLREPGEKLTDRWCH